MTPLRELLVHLSGGSPNASPSASPAQSLTSSPASSPPGSPHTSRRRMTHIQLPRDLTGLQRRREENFSIFEDRLPDQAPPESSDTNASLVYQDFISSGYQTTKSPGGTQYVVAKPRRPGI